MKVLDNKNRIFYPSSKKIFQNDNYIENFKYLNRNLINLLILKLQLKNLNTIKYFQY